MPLDATTQARIQHLPPPSYCFFPEALFSSLEPYQFLYHRHEQDVEHSHQARTWSKAQTVICNKMKSVESYSDKWTYMDMKYNIYILVWVKIQKQRRHETTKWQQIPRNWWLAPTKISFPWLKNIANLANVNHERTRIAGLIFPKVADCDF